MEEVFKLPGSNIGYSCTELKQESPTSCFGRFIFLDLEPDQGHALGTLFRQILLNHEWGLGITGIKIKGTDDEFSNLKGLREDTLDLCLNAQKIVFAPLEFKYTDMDPYYHKQNILMYLSVQGPGVVTAKDFKFVAAEPAPVD